RYNLSGRDQRPESFHTEALGIIEVGADNLITARIWFDLDDVDAALEELDARYLAGEAAAYADTWSFVVQAYAALNRHEPPATTPDFVDIEHRQLAPIGSGDLIAYVHSTLDLTPKISTYVEAVHRLTARGAVVTHVGKGTSQEGFDAE